MQDIQFPEKIHDARRTLPEIKNYMEICVNDALDGVIKGMGACTCMKCRYDITAIALNSLPPKYVVTGKGQMYTKIISLQQQFEVDVIAAVTRACTLVSKSPKHDTSDDNMI